MVTLHLLQFDWKMVLPVVLSLHQGGVAQNWHSSSRRQPLLQLGKATTLFFAQIWMMQLID